MTAAAMAAPSVPAFAGRADVEVAVPVAADAPTAKAALTDWPSQGRWMVGTKVWASRGDGTAVGDELSGWTGVGRLGFLDTMDITAVDGDWVVVEHTGKVVRGYGWMGAVSAPDGAVLVWGEAVRLPLGPLGRLGWLIVRPLLELGVRHSLRRLARLIERGELPGLA